MSELLNHSLKQISSRVGHISFTQTICSTKKKSD